MNLFNARFITAVVGFLAMPMAYGSHWISDFNGVATSYRIVRGDELLPMTQLMSLQAGDAIFVDDPDGQVIVIDDQNRNHRLTSENTPFIVPESESPPQLLINVRNWIANWWSTRGSQSTSTMAAVSKGGLEPEISIATGSENYLLPGTRDLHVVWNGGIQPFDVAITDLKGEILREVTTVVGNAVTLSNISMHTGRYDLRVSAGDARSTVTLEVVGAEALPAPARDVLTIDLPEKIRFGHVAMILSGYDAWRFEAFQLARNYELIQMARDLLAGNFPNSDINEANYVPAHSNTRQ